MSLLEDNEVEMDSTCMSELGDSITYKPASGSFASALAYVAYPEVLRDIETGAVIEQEITVDLLRTDYPVKPSDACRVTLAKLPGKLFKPINIRLDEAGTHWRFEVKRVNA